MRRGCDKSTTLPLGLPRFYCDDPRAIAWLKADDEPRHLSLQLHTAWTERPAENLICVLPPPRGTGDWINQWVIGADATTTPHRRLWAARPAPASAFNARLNALGLAREIAAAPAHCGVVLVWTAGDAWNLRGTREFLDLLHRGSRAGQAVKFLQERFTSAEHQADAAANDQLSAKPS